MTKRRSIVRSLLNKVKNIFMTQAQGPIYAIEKDIKRDKEKKHGAINAL